MPKISKVPTGKVASPGLAMRLHQNPFSPVPGNVAATSQPGGAAGAIPVPSYSSKTMQPPPVGPKAPVQKFANGGMVKPGGSGNVPKVMQSKVMKTNC